MKWEDPVFLDQGGVSIPDSWLFLHYYEALTVLFRLENALRMFVYVTLKKHYKERWTDLTITSEDAAEGTIASIARRRHTQAQGFGYLGYSSNCPMMYLTSGELIQLITSEKQWKLFKDSFVATKQVVKHKLDEFSTVRNALAHFRPIRKEDVDLIKTIARHVLIEVEKELVELYTCRVNVPTNTEDEWYVQLRSLGTDEIDIRFRQSPSEKWVRIELSHTNPILRVSTYSNFSTLLVLSLRASEILRQHKSLTNLLVYASESVGYAVHKKPSELEIEKTVSLVLSKATLQAEWEVVRSELIQILETVSSETQMLTQDTLARGKLVETSRASAQRRDGSDVFTLDGDSIRSPRREDDPPEWWGKTTLFEEDDLISVLHAYPWMSTDVSDLVLGF